MINDFPREAQPFEWQAKKNISIYKELEVQTTSLQI